MSTNFQPRDEVKYGNNPHVWTIGEIVDRPKPEAILHRIDPITTKTGVPLSELLLVRRPAEVPA